MKLASEKATPAIRTTEVTIVMVPVGLFIAGRDGARRKQPFPKPCGALRRTRP